MSDPIKFEWREILTRRGGSTGCFGWFRGDERMCDHEHDEDEQRHICEDAEVSMSNIRARQARQAGRSSHDF